ncbi:MAG: hypothetical protein IKB98_06495 [Clostridia bacterium]|nr:hypothetical protein [Clostridia bacterium]
MAERIPKTNNDPVTNLVMNYVTPNSDIWLLRGINLNNTYQNTIWHSDATQQFQYFCASGSQFVKYHLQKYSYQRYSRGRIWVDLPLENIQDCNYLVFKNSGLQNNSEVYYDKTPNIGANPPLSKTYYCFITNFEYSNNNTTIIDYEIDVMQTYMFDYELGECFVEREHTNDDTIGSHTVEENLPIGEYWFLPVTSAVDIPEPTAMSTPPTNAQITARNNYCNSYRDEVKNGRIIALDNDREPYSVVVSCGFDYVDGNVEPVEGNMYGGFYSGLTYFSFNVLDGRTDTQQTTESEVNTFLKNVTSDGAAIDSILNIYMLPHFIAKSLKANPETAYQDLEIKFPANTVWDLYSSNTPEGNRQPRNKKLYTYPFSLLYITDNMGNAGMFRYEFFSSVISSSDITTGGGRYDAKYLNQKECEFRLQGLTTANPEVQLVPEDYNLTGTTQGADRLNYNDKISISAFPQCAYNVDSFKAWLAQHSRVLIGQAVNTGIGVAKSLAVPALKGAELTKLDKFNAGTDVLSQAVSSIAQIAQAEALPPQARGQQTQALPVANGSFGFQLYHLYPRAEYAQIIDDFFTRFGYACKRVKIPNTHVRQNWTYTKTNGCILKHGTKKGLPAQAERMICNIFDNGITFWSGNGVIGSYATTSNLPITPAQTNS